MLAALDLDANALAMLCDQQHVLQETHISRQYPHAERRMILADGKPVGRLCLDRRTEPGRGMVWWVIDIALVPEAQGRGVGTSALSLLRAEAAAVHVPIELTVSIANPRAAELYLRLGFVEVESGDAVQRRMVLAPLRGDLADVN